MVSSRFKRNFSITLQEKKDFFLTNLVLTLIFFFLFKNLLWLHEEVSVFFIISKLVLLFIITGVVLALAIFVAKRYAIIHGYTAHYYSWKNGLLIGFVLSFLSYGFLPVLFPGVITLKRIERHRHGKLYPGENLHEIFWMILFVESTFFLIAIISSFLFFITNIVLFYYFMIIASIIAFFSLLPFNNNLGSHFFFSKRFIYFFFLFFSFFLSLFLLLRLYYAVLFAIIIMLIVYFLSKNILKKIFGN